MFVVRSTMGAYVVLFGYIHLIIVRTHIVYSAILLLFYWTLHFHAIGNTLGCSVQL
jgi:hypothetical protein